MSSNLEFIIEKLKKVERQRNIMIFLVIAMSIVLVISLYFNLTKQQKTVVKSGEITETSVVQDPPKPLPIKVKKLWEIRADLFSEDRKKLNQWVYVKSHDLMNGDTFIITQSAKLVSTISEFTNDDRSTYLTLVIRFQSKGRKEVYFDVGYADLAASANTEDFPLVFKFDDGEPLNSNFSKGTNGSFFMDVSDIDAFFDLATKSKKCFVRFVRKDDIKMDIAIDCAGLTQLLIER